MDANATEFPDSRVSIPYQSLGDKTFHGKISSLRQTPRFSIVSALKFINSEESQKVNLEDISVAKLADQFHEFITKAKKINLESASEYLLMATWLTYLKSKLLLPQSDEEEFKDKEWVKYISA